MRIYSATADHVLHPLNHSLAGHVPEVLHCAAHTILMYKQYPAESMRSRPWSLQP